jgi:hypothetical protein
LVQHFAFRPDRLIEIPPTALVDTPALHGSWIRVDAAQTDGTLRLHLRPWERNVRRLVSERVLSCSAAELRDLLDRRS